MSRHDDHCCDAYDQPVGDTDLDAAWDELTPTERRAAMLRAQR